MFKLLINWFHEKFSNGTPCTLVPPTKMIKRPIFIIQCAPTYLLNPVTIKYCSSRTQATLAPFLATISPPSTIGVDPVRGLKIRILPSLQTVAKYWPLGLHSELNICSMWPYKRKGCVVIVVFITQCCQFCSKSQSKECDVQPCPGCLLFWLGRRNLQWF